MPFALRVLSFALALLWATRAHAQEQQRSTHTIHYAVLQSGDVQVEEKISIAPTRRSSPVTRSLWLQRAAHAWPLLQRIDEVSVVDSSGAPLSFRKREYEERVNVDFREIPSDGTVVLRYRVHRALDVSGPVAHWQWNVSGHSWGASLSDVEIRVTSVSHSGKEEVALVYRVGYDSESDSVPVSAVLAGAETVFSFSPHAPVGEPVSFVLVLPSEGLGPVPASWFKDDLLLLFRTSAILFALVLGLAFLQVFLPSHTVIAMTQITNFAAVVPAWLAAYGATVFWYYEPGDRGVGNDFIGELFVNFGLAGFILLFAIKQYKLLGEVKRSAYFAQLAYPTVLMVAWPIALVDRSMLVFPLLALPTFLYWPRKKVALEFGVGAHRIAEMVVADGEITFAELAARSGMPEKRLVLVLEQSVGLPMVMDYNRRRVMSAAVASMRKGLQVCRHCGGASMTGSAAQMVCGYCKREYASSHKEESETTAPMPVVVETVSTYFETLGNGVLVLAFVIALAIFSMELMGGSLVGAVIGAAVAGVAVLIPGAVMHTIADALRKGKGIAFLRFLMLLAFPLIFPFFVWLRLGSRRVQLFSGATDVKELEKALEKDGEWSLQAFAAYMQTNQEDAAEYAQYLVANQLIDAVYERRHSRLVSRALYRDIAQEQDCKNCGGYFGVFDGKALCHYCGHGPTTFSSREGSEK